MARQTYRMTYLDAARQSLADAVPTLRKANIIAPDVTLRLRTDGELWWIAYIREGMGENEFLRTTAAIGHTAVTANIGPRDVLAYVHGFVTAVYATVGDSDAKPIGAL